jgi:hypothetical protein
VLLVSSMRLRLPARFRVLLMLIAFGIGLAGQAVAMSMPMPMSQDSSNGAAVSMGGMEDCSGCAGSDSSSNTAKDMMPTCAAGVFCSASVAPAIPAQLRMIFPPGDAIRFAIAADVTVRGLSIPPDLGPPRLNHRS